MVLFFCSQQIIIQFEICIKFWFLAILALNIQRCIYYFFALLSQTPVLEELFGNVHPLPTPLVVSASVLMWSLLWYRHFCVKWMSAYHLYGICMCVYTLIMWLPFQPTAEPMVDNIHMAGYMEKLPVKSNQKKVHAVMKSPAMSIVHWSPSPVACENDRLSLPLGMWCWPLRAPTPL